MSGPKRQAAKWLCVVGAVFGAWESAFALDLTGNYRLHDPSRIYKEGNRYYTFHTGSSNTPIQSKFSENLTHWQFGAGVFANGTKPAWATAEVPGGGNMWAPDLFYHNGEYRLYYSYSTFGSQNSVIGLATNTTLDFMSPNYAWVDQGMVIESEIGFPFNAIDAAIFHDESTGRQWMTFGSFWNGIYITELDPTTGKRITPNSSTLNIARNAVNPPNAIEAPYLTKHGEYYYLFVNWDTCCQGTNSTYNIRYGRSTSPTGPFRGRDGVPMTSGGGEMFLATQGSQIGPGHFSEYSENGINYFTYHYYDANDSGFSKLGIDEFAWTYDGWAVLVSDLPAGDYNRDGIVDALDYTVWRNTFGSTENLWANGDNTGDSMGVIDLADYQVWKSNYGATYSAGAGAGGIAIAPEPSVKCLIAFGAAMISMWRRLSVSR